MSPTRFAGRARGLRFLAVARATTLAGLALMAGGAALAAGPSATGAAANPATAPTSDTAEARYQRERTRCLSGQSQEDTQTCLREAGAARQAAHEHDLTDPNADQQAANARRRCDAFKSEDDRQACIARVGGQGTSAGSVNGGGVLHQYTQVSPAPANAAAPATLPTPPSPSALPAANATTPGNPPTPAPTGH